MEKYLIAVKHEIEMLKTHATKKERNKLILKDFNPLNPTTCIYGQMTDNCFSKRATELISLCTNYGFKTLTLSNVNDIKEMKLGRIVGSDLQYTPLEHFIVNYKEYTKDIIAFLKEEKNKLPEIFN